LTRRSTPRSVSGGFFTGALPAPCATGSPTDLPAARVNAWATTNDALAHADVGQNLELAFGANSFAAIPSAPFDDSGLT
jgi:hypothetical protein